MKKLTFFTILLLFIDQVAKNMVSFFMDIGSSITIIPKFFNLTYVQNDGAAFSILRGNRWFFIVIGIIALNLIYIFFIKNKDLKTKEIFLYSLLISGIVGNMIDRIIYGKVIDFFDFTIFGHPFAIFNVADIYIVVSIILLIIISIWRDYQCKKSSAK